MSELHLQNKRGEVKDRKGPLFLLLAIVLISQVGGYGYLVNSSVGHVVSRMSYEKQTDELSSKVARLEAEYFSLQNKVTIETAEAMHYTNNASVYYVDEHGSPVVMLSRSN